MKLSLFNLLLTFLGAVVLLSLSVEAFIEHLSVPVHLWAGEAFNVTFHTRKANPPFKQWMAIVGVSLGRPADNSLGTVLGPVYLDQRHRSVSGDGQFSVPFIAPNWPKSVLGRKGRLVTVTAQYFETYSPTNKGRLRIESIVATLHP